MKIINAKLNQDGNFVTITFDDGSIGSSSITDGIRRQYTYILDEWVLGGGVIAPFETQAEITTRQTNEANVLAKEAKLLALNTITVTTINGNIFDGDETARLNMNNAISSSQFLGLTEATWKLADNSTALVQLTELQEALALAIQKVGDIVTAQN